MWVRSDLTSSAKAGSSDFEQDLVTRQVWLLGLALLDGAIFRALEDCEGRHID